MGEGEGLRGDFRRTKVEIGVIAGRSDSVQGFCPCRKGLSDRARDALMDRGGEALKGESRGEEEKA